MPKSGSTENSERTEFMKGPDAGLRKLFHQKLPKPEWVWAAVETGASAAGLPDSHFLFRPKGLTGWVESKKADHWAITFEPHQIQFHRLHAPHIRSFIAVKALGANQTDGKGEALYLYPGTDVDALDEVGLRHPPLLRITGAARTWDWGLIGRILTS